MQDVTLALPRIVGKDGILETLPLSLSEDEQAALIHSAEIIRHAIDELSL